MENPTKEKGDVCGDKYHFPSALSTYINGGRKQSDYDHLSECIAREKKEHTRVALINPMALLEEAWVIIANASGGNWDKETKEWKSAAMRFRDKYFVAIKK